MQSAIPPLPYATPKPPNPWATASLVSGIVLFVGSLVPICGLAVIPLAWMGLVVGAIGLYFAIWKHRRGLAKSIIATVLCLAAAFIPMGMLGTVPFLAEFWLKYTHQQAPTATQGKATTTKSLVTTPVSR